MSELSNSYQQIMKDLQTNIKDAEDKVYVMNKFQELSMMFMDVIDRLTNITDLRIKEVEAQQRKIDDRMTKIQDMVDEIEGDIYEDDETYDFEIICPYCNHEFITDINADINTEIECPECHNMIELDWNGEEDGCDSDCSCCEHECVAEEDAIYDDMEELDEELEELEDLDDKEELKMQKKSSKAKEKKMKKQDKDDEDENDEDM